MNLEFVDLYGNTVGFLRTNEGQPPAAQYGSFTYISKDSTKVVYTRREMDSAGASIIFAKGSVQKTSSSSGSTTGLTDIDGHWGKASIGYLVNKAAISGYPDGTFRPNGTITKAEFLKIAYASVTGTFTKSASGHWASGVFNDAMKNGIVLEGEMPASTWDRPITRYEMTRIMIRLTENILKEAKTSTAGVSSMMSDYDKVRSQEAYLYFVEQAFMKGLIAGKTSDGLFDGLASGTRAEASTMIHRILESSIRIKVTTAQ